MAIETARQPVSPITVPVEAIWRLSVSQYQDMIEAGILTDDDPIELLEGWLVTKMPKKPPHSLATQLTRDALLRMLPSGWHVSTQEPITTDDSEPEPDVVIVRGELRQYRDRHPHPADVRLLVEVSDATLLRDRTVKKRLYARAGIVTYWIINLVDEQVEVYTEPSGATEQPDYVRRQDFGIDDVVPVVLEGKEVARLPVRELLP